jgi:hypothetical protein
MTSLSVSDCCHLFAIDPKTLRQWLAQAQMSLQTHPTDARIKCLTSEQVHELANLHDRVLQASGPALASASLKPDEVQSRVPPAVVSDADLRTRLVQVEAQVATLQAQLTALALQLLQEREQRTEQRLLRLETQLSPTRQPLLSPSARSVPLEQATPALACHPTFAPTKGNSTSHPILLSGLRGWRRSTRSALSGNRAV